jgi:hypothetical protein
MTTTDLNIEDPAALEAYLVAARHCAVSQIAEHQPLAGGVSGRTVRVAFSDGREWVIKQALPKLRVQSDWFSDPRRIHREALGMKTLAALAPAGAVPELVFDDPQWHVIGMQAVRRPHDNWKSLLLAGAIEQDHVRQFAVLLGVVHRESRRRYATLAGEFADRSFFESLRLEPYYEFSAAQEPATAEFYRQLLADTRATRSALVHGDYSPKNVLVRGGRLTLLDHEVIHWGDPAFDVGFALTHLLSKAHHLPKWRCELLDAARFWWSVYRGASTPVENEQLASDDFPSQTTLAPDSACARHTLGCLLARVVGRSPLEYLAPPERARQRAVVAQFMADPPADPPELIDRFAKAIES